MRRRDFSRCDSGGHSCTLGWAGREGRIRKHVVEIVGRLATNGWACCYLYPTAGVEKG